MKKFAKKCEEMITNDLILINNDIQEIYDNFMKYLKLCIKETVPKRRDVSKNPVPWWTKECTEKIKERNRMCNKMSRKITFEKVDEYLKKKAEAQRVLAKQNEITGEHFAQSLIGICQNLRSGLV